MEEIQKLRSKLLAKLDKLQDKRLVLKDADLRALYSKIKEQPEAERAAFGQAVNDLKKELEQLASDTNEPLVALAEIDVTAPLDVNSGLPQLLPTENGTIHPITRELSVILDIFARMGFEAVESRQLDDDYHMFTSLNFPADHPARDDYDTFMTEEGLIAPAHTSTMQNRVLSDRKDNLKKGEAIRVLLPGRTFRNEDLDARHEHTFHQFEGVYVDKGINVGHLMATFKTFLQEYYGKELDVRITPFYFPFTEPSFEFSLSCPFCDQKGCSICSHEGWIELLGMGMIHPNVLKMAGIDAKQYTGFAWGCGVERLVMMKQNIEDIRHFNSGKLQFLRQFK